MREEIKSAIKSTEMLLPMPRAYDLQLLLKKKKKKKIIKKENKRKRKKKNNLKDHLIES